MHDDGMQNMRRLSFCMYGESTQGSMRNVRTAKVHNEICAIYYVGHFVCTAKVQREVRAIYVAGFCMYGVKYFVVLVKSTR